MTPQTLSDQLTQTINDALVSFEAISIESWNEKPLPNRWSKKEIVGHLIDSALNNIHRFVRAQYDDQTNIYYDQDFWVKVGNYQNQEVNEVVVLWRLLNLQIAQVWNNTLAGQLNKTIPVKDQHPTLLYLMEDYILHMQHHLRQINS